MDYFLKMTRKISIKSIAVHAVGLIVSMAVIWGISYLILVTFSIQDQEVAVTSASQSLILKNVKNGDGATSTNSIKTATSTPKIGK